MSSRPRFSIGAIGLALLALALASRTASSQQCFINGPFSICPGETAELCGPAEGDYGIEWTLPDGTHSSDRCVTVSGGGVWWLRLFDYGTGQWTECSREVVQPGEAASCAIEGPTSACDGTAVTLCGPESASSWTWSGPGGFTSDQRCIDVTAGGTYTLSIPGSPECGPAMVECSQDVTFEACQTIENCPRPPVFWASQCRSARDDGNTPSRVNPLQLAAVASCVDQHTPMFDWSGDDRAFCRTMMPSNTNLRTKAKRQFAGVWANVCAGEANIVPARGPRVGLDPLALVLINGERGTVSSWLVITETRLTALDGAIIKDETVKEMYRAIIREGWMINHGQGVEPACGLLSRKGLTSRLDEEIAEDLAGDESLEEALADESDAPMAMTITGANPFGSSATLALTLGSNDARDVRVGVYDLTGRLVRELANGRLEPGRHEIRWDGIDQSGARAHGGVYFVIGRVGGDRVSARLTLVR